VSTSAGRVRGIRREGSAAFLGIPFAEPPVGERRLAAPVSHAPWDGVRDATRYGATPQREPLAAVTLIPEPSVPGHATLNLNVFTPQPGDTDARLPVLVWIHGGAYVAGSPASPWYDGAAFNRDGIVTVTLSYRLGFDGFGWLEDAPVNRAVRDWLLALEWVQDNIAAFGGGPRRVTLAGQSAGGAAVLSLLAVPTANDLFHRAISLSGSILEVPKQLAQESSRELAGMLGASPRREGMARISESRLVRAQRAVGPVPAVDPFNSDLAGHFRQIASGQPLAWAPVIDDDLILEPLLDAAARGIGNDKPLLLGCTEHEFISPLTGHLRQPPGTELAAAVQSIGVPRSVVDAAAASHEGAGIVELAARVISDLLCRAPSWRFAQQRAAAGAATWLYRFAWPSPILGDAGHCLDIPFFFDCLTSEGVSDLVGPDPPLSLATEVHGAAVRFIRGENPGWPSHTTSSPAVRTYR
jgi:para-nitrobenzyl esterase